MRHACTFVVPGDINARTGGYEYDRRMIDALRGRNWAVTLCQLDDGFPQPSPATRARAAATLHGIADGSVVVIDGLALGVLPDEAIAEKIRLRIVALVHHPLAMETGMDAATVSWLRASEQRALTAARRVIVTSPATARTLTQYGVPTADISVVVPGTDRAGLAAGSGGGAVELLCVGSIVPRKGHELLVRALATLKDLSWHLTCAGSLDRDPAASGALLALVKSEGLERRVECVGELPEPELAARYARADVFVLPTLYEGYGMAVAEAVSHGLPVVASDTGGIAEVLAGEAGIALPPGDLHALTSALRRVVSDPATRTALAAGAARVRDRLPSWEDTSAVMDRVLIEVATA